MKIEFTLPLPPSSNKIYFNLPKRGKKGGGRALTKEAIKWKEQAKELIQEVVGPQLFDLDMDSAFRREYTFFHTIFNKGYPKQTNNLFKKKDMENRFKLLGDAIAAATGVDDSHILSYGDEEVHSKRDVVHVVLRPIDVCNRFEEVWSGRDQEETPE